MQRWTPSVSGCAVELGFRGSSSFPTTNQLKIGWKTPKLNIHTMPMGKTDIKTLKPSLVSKL